MPQRRHAGGTTAPQQIVDRILELEEGTRFQVLPPVVREREGEYETLLSDLAKQGFARAIADMVVLSLQGGHSQDSPTTPLA